MPIQRVWLAIDNLTDVGYSLYSEQNVMEGSRITSGITNTGDGWYEAVISYPSTWKGSIQWNSLSKPSIRARIYITPNSNPSFVPTSNNENYHSDMGLARRVWRDSALPESTFNFILKEDAERWVATSVIPGAKDYVQARIQPDIVPFTYPLKDEILIGGFTTFSLTEIHEIQNGWASSFDDVVYMVSLARLFLLADTVNELYLAKSRAFMQSAEVSLNALTKSIKFYLNRIPNSNVDKLGLMVVKLPKRRSRGEYSW